MREYEGGEDERGWKKGWKSKIDAPSWNKSNELSVIREQSGEITKTAEQQVKQAATQIPLSTAFQRNSNVPKVKSH